MNGLRSWSFGSWQLQLGPEVQQRNSRYHTLVIGCYLSHCTVLLGVKSNTEIASNCHDRFRVVQLIAISAHVLTHANQLSAS